ncbi:hypothetical protein CNMCM5623_005274 [Aspergillus felis]|uniref:Uncharacterized protein n=1 Tax=Aspergillus felis TaxID=1287682 RepID=A0A8H6PI98_9EURO|nr:hypothetical protein CNMCM5623_005274 [Aspergillus felis]KAF7175365.1 hypothetical protein CNMCM7691_007956 [Aspergillus felis]
MFSWLAKAFDTALRLPETMDLKQVSDMIIDAFDNVVGKDSHGLQESRHAPKKEDKAKNLKYSQQVGRPSVHFSVLLSVRFSIMFCAPDYIGVFAQAGHAHVSSHVGPINKTSRTSGGLSFPSNIRPLKPRHSRYSSGDSSYNSYTPSKMAELTKEYPVADVDDAAGFMAFARALREKQAREAAAAAKTQADLDTSTQQNGVANDFNDFGGQSSVDANGSAPVSASNDAWPSEASHSRNDDGFGDFENNTDNNNASLMPGIVDDAEAPKASAFGFRGDAAEFILQEIPVVASENVVSATKASDNAVVEEDRENLATFKSWGVPVARDKPAAQVRRVIIKGLPSAWSSPTKVLSLIHGGMVENIHINPTGNQAHILFCDHEACKSFYDKYPNGIDIDKEKRKTVFVEMGKEVDAISSQLSFNLSIGSTRVVRAVGVSVNINMGELLKLAGANNRKVEKIMDSCVPGEPRNVVFRFCSIDDAVKFRAAILRDADWEHCNIQHAADPCELATGFHAD